MKLKLLSLCLLPVSLLACSADHKREGLESAPTEDRRDKGLGSFLGEDNLHFGGTKKREQEDTGLGVNSHLWRASLDTVSFMPIASADPFGGVIITDWYSPPQNPNERLKVNVFILDRQLRSDGIKVSIFRQERDRNSQWIDQPVAPQTAKDLEETILTRARHFKIKSAKT